MISSGGLDPAFSGDGLVNAPIGASSDQARGIAIQSDGRYVVGGWSNMAGNFDFSIARFNSDGSIDASFSGDGIQVTSIAAGSLADRAYGLAIQADGKVILAGSTANGGNDDFAIVRYDTNGNLDATFSGDGIQTTSLSTTNDVAMAVAIQADGKILAAGNSGMNFAIARYDVSGTLDVAFDGDGILTSSYGNSTSVANAMALQEDGKIIVAGYGWSGVSWDFGVARLTSSGLPDVTFNADGKTLFHLNSTSTIPEEFNAVAIQSDGKILLAGRTVGAVSGDSYDAVVMRLDSGGNLDATFGGGDGVVTLNLSNWDEFTSVEVQADGKILAAGSDGIGFGEALIARFNTDGTLDTSFNGDGVLSTTFASGTSAIYDLAMAPSGQVVVAGDSYTGNYDFGMLRLSSGVPDQNVMAGSTFSYTVPVGAFFDVEGNALTYSATLSNGAALPDWLVFSADTRTFLGTPATADFGVNEITVTASDGISSVASNFQLEVSTSFIEALRYTDHARWNDGFPNGTSGTSLTFSFMSAAPSYATLMETSTFASMVSETEKQAVRDVLQLYSDIAGVSFTEVADSGTGGQLRFGTYLETGGTTAGYSYSPGTVEQCGDVWINRDNAGYNPPAAGNGSYGTLVHEVGHALGLKHPGPYGGGVPPYLDAAVDNNQYTVMSYNARTDNLYRDVTGTTSADIRYFNVFESTQMLYDVAAIQFIYGVNTSTRSGNDTYIFDPAVPFFKTLWDGGGIDTISVSNFNESCAIDLRDGNYSTLRIAPDPLPPAFTGGTEPTYAGINNLAIAYGCVIENVVGGNGDDIVTCNDADNILDGGAGSDTMRGGAGNDVYVIDATGTLIADFVGNDIPSQWYASDGWGNGGMFLSNWQADHAVVAAGNLNLQLDANGLVGGEYASTATTGYGLYAARLQAASGAGIITSLFTYNGTPHDEIDIEILGKDTTKVQFNYFVNGVGGHEAVIDLGFDAATGFHDYAFDWQADSIRWYVDGVLKHEVTAVINGTLPGTPGKLMANLWAAQGVDGWSGTFVSGTAHAASYDWIKYQGDAVIENANEGIDTVQSAISYSLTANVENLTLTGTGAINGVGNALDNVLTGNAGNNTFTGAGGRDVFAFVASGNGIDTITDFSVGDRISIAGASFSGVVAVGDGSAVLANQVQFDAMGDTTTLFIGTDAVAGADVQIKLAGSYTLSHFSLNGEGLYFNSLPTGSVTISGTPSLNQTLTASNTLADADGLGMVAYQWNANGIDITGATGATYTLTQTEVGKSIGVVASYIDGAGTNEAVASSSVNIYSLMATSKYFVTQSAGANLMHFDLVHGALSLQGQDIVFTGTNGIDNVTVAPGLKLDFTKSNGGIDNLYLTGNLADYTTTFTTSTVTLSRGTGASAETVLLAKGTSLNYDTVAFANGSASTFDLHGWAAGGAIPTLGAAPVPPATLNATVKGFALDASGEVFTGTAPGINFIATGGNGVDIVYVKAGATVDASKLNSGEDKIYFTGNWADYTKAATSSKITFTNGTTGDTVIVAAAAGASNDRLVFADGYVLSNDAKTALLTDAAVSLSIITGSSTAEVTPLGTGSVVTGTAAADNLNGTAAGDVIYGNGGADFIDGGAGADQIVVADAGTTAVSSATIRIVAMADGTDSVVGFSAAPVANGGDVLDLSAIANLIDAVATVQTLATDFTAANVFIFDATPVAIADAASVIAADVSVVATEGYIVIADAANANAVTVYHSTDLANNGTETALAILSGVNIVQLTVGNLLV